MCVFAGGDGLSVVDRRTTLSRLDGGLEDAPMRICAPGSRTASSIRRQLDADVDAILLKAAGKKSDQSILDRRGPCGGYSPLPGGRTDPRTADRRADSNRALDPPSPGDLDRYRFIALTGYCDHRRPIRRAVKTQANQSKLVSDF